MLTMLLSPWSAVPMPGDIRLGASIDAVGDVDGDGYPEVVAGSAWTDPSAGRAELFAGGPGHPSRFASWFIDGVESDEARGSLVAGVGDLNADGYDDVAVAAEYPTFGDGTFRPAVWIFYGSPTGLSPAPDIALDGLIDAEYNWDGVFGDAVTSGDFNCDGIVDLVVGANRWGEGGAVFVYHGSKAGIPEVPDTIVEGPLHDGRFGGAVSDAGDVTGDGCADLLVGAPGYPGIQDTGAAYLFAGSHIGLGTIPVWSVTGADGDKLGTSVAGPGDLDGNGHVEIVIGAPEQRADRASDAAVRVFRGTGSSPWLVDGGTLGAPDELPFFGTTVRRAGDTNGDGFLDLAVWAGPYGLRPEVYVYGGSPTLLSGTPWTARGGRGFGQGLSAGTDFNRDGLPDLLVGTPYDESRGTHRIGGVVLYLGQSSGPTGDLDGDGSPDSEDCAANNAEVHPGATEVCDGFDNDCDGTVDNDAPEATDWYADVDADGYGDRMNAWFACFPPIGGVVDANDCDDADPLVHPGASEIDGNGVDDDCDRATPDTPKVDAEEGCGCQSSPARVLPLAVLAAAALLLRGRTSGASRW